MTANSPDLYSLFMEALEIESVEQRAAFLDNDWEFKANLRMRLEDLSRDAYVQGTNPIRWAAHSVG